MDITAVEVIVGLVAVGVGWLHMRINTLETKKADKEDVDELKLDMKQVSSNIVDLKVDTTRCLTILESLAKTNSKND